MSSRAMCHTSSATQGAAAAQQICPRGLRGAATTGGEDSAELQHGDSEAISSGPGGFHAGQQTAAAACL